MISFISLTTQLVVPSVNLCLSQLLDQPTTTQSIVLQGDHLVDYIMLVDPLI